VWDGDVIDLTSSVSSWIRKHRPSGVVEPLEAAFRKAPGESETGWRGYDALFRALLELAPERAGRVVLELQHRTPKSNLPRVLTHNLGGWVACTTLVGFYDVLLSRTDLPQDERVSLYRDMPYAPSPSIKDPAKRAEDAKAFVTFLEGRLTQESDAGVRRAVEQKLAELRNALEQAQNQ
jgi:hypothetical protein